VAGALQYKDDDYINAAFMRNHRGNVCIAFSDPAYARADSVLVDADHLAIHLIIHGNSYFIGHVSEGMLGAFCENGTALLTALRPDGTVLELEAPIEILSNNNQDTKTTALKEVSWGD
jgi:hypothetical protein